MALIDRMLKHTCTIQKNAPSTATAATWGQQGDSFVDYETDVPCLMQSYGSKRDQAEVVNRFTDAAQVEWYMLFMRYREDLIASGAEQTYQITNVQDAQGNMLHAGPLNIRLVMNAAGQQHHLEVVVSG